MPEHVRYRLEALRDDGELILYRGHEPGEPHASVLIVAAAAEQPSPRSLVQLEHECSLAADLDPAWAARPVKVTRRDGRPMLLLTDPGGEPLDRILERSARQPLEQTRVLRIAIGMASALGRLHRRGLIHKDIKPGNVLVDDADHVWLTGFGIASRLPRESQGPAPPEIIAGTLAYMAPEQTGRMNRSIDTRSDLYSLGITLYRMLTGALPFSAADPLEWVHCHIARQPTPPHDRAGVPEPLSLLTMKLLAKNAEERYQTASGVEADLRRCLAQLESLGRIEAFPLGAHDASDRLLISEKLYGRQPEIDALLTAFNRVITDGTPALVLVSGYSGVGKSSVVHELHKVLVPSRGLFASGKFDQYKRDIPYATLAQAFQSLIRPLLSKSEAELRNWRDAIREALGPNALLMVDLVPELRLIIGEPPPVPELPPQDAHHRFQLVFRRFISVFAQAEHPLVLFLDDLQWLDAVTLDLLEWLLTAREVGHLLIVGAYRDNEVGASHPLVQSLAAIRAAGASVREMVLAPLQPADLERFVADALHCERARAAPLARLVRKKTGGNPFFAGQFVTALAEEGLLTFDSDAMAWTWDLTRIRARHVTDNVVDLLVGKLTRLPAETQEALQHLACLGNRAQTATLRLVHDTSESAVHGTLWEAVRAGLVFPLEGGYTFLHDRVQEAAYATIPEHARAARHLRIGRRLAAGLPDVEREEASFEIAGHFNRGAALIDSPAEREQAAKLNLIAGSRARTATAYVSALNYFAAGAALLAEGDSTRQYPLTFALEFQRAECEFLTGDLAAAEARLSTLSRRAATTVERASVTCLRADLYTTLDQGSRAIAVGLDYLRHLGIDWSPHPTEDEARREYERIWSQLGSRAIEALIDLPLMSDPVSLATLDVLGKMATPALYTDANLYLLVICRQVNLSLEGGNCDASCFAYEWLAMVAGARFGDYQAAYSFGRLGYDLVERWGLNRFRARTYLIFGGLIIPWTKHVKMGRDLLRRSFDAADKIGDLTYAAYSCEQLNTNMLAAGDPLVEAQRECENGLAFAQHVRFGLVIDLISAELGLVRTLRGLTRTFGSFDDDRFDEREIERRFAGNPDLALAECWYSIRKLQARFFAGDYAAAVEAASTAQRLLWTAVSRFETAEYHFYGALSHAASCDAASGEQRRQHLEVLIAHHRQLEIWAANCPENFENRAALVGAEIARIEGRALEAMDLYEQAIRSARANGFAHNEALANELTGRFYEARGFEKIAHAYVQDARYCYLRWGADGKVRQLDQLYPHLREAKPGPGPTTTIGASVEQLDLATVIKVSQAVSGEIVLDKLIDTLMRTAVEHAGAERALLILPRGDALRIEAEATTSGDTVTVHLREASVTATELPESILRYVVRTLDSAILDDASAQNPFSADEYIRHKHARSVLCLPLLKQATLIGVLYLENSLTSHVFTPTRIAVLKLLASQAAISLENTRLYRDLQEREAKIRRLVDSNIIGILISDLEGGILDANDAFLEMVGYGRDDVVSGQMRWLDMTPVEWVGLTKRAVAQLKATGTCDPFEKEYFRKDGSRVPVLVGAAAFEGRREEAVAFVLDLSERKRAEEALRQSEEQWRDVFENNPTMYFMVDAAGTVLAVNPFGAEMLGYSVEELVGQPVLGVFYEFDRKAVKRNVARCLEQLGRPRSWEARKVRKDGTVRWVRETAKAVPRETGPIVLIAGEDMTERKRAEDALRQAQADLAHVSRVTTLGEMAASIAHEVNQPLSGVVINANASLRWLAAEPPEIEEARNAIRRIIRDGKLAGQVIARVRTLSRKGTTEKERLDLNAAIQEVLGLAQSEVTRTRVTLRTAFDPDLPPVMGDRVQLQQVVLNLTLNGIEAMSDVVDRPRELTISTHREDVDRARVVVRDAGVGLDPEQAHRIFEAFYTTKRAGLGMGLSISRSIVEQHGGRLWAVPNDGPGTTFHFTL